MEMKNVLDQLKAIAENNDSEDVARAIETADAYSFKDRLKEAEAGHPLPHKNDGYDEDDEDDEDDDDEVTQYDIDDFFGGPADKKGSDGEVSETPGDDGDQYCANCGNTGYSLDTTDEECPNCDGDSDATDAFGRISDRVDARNGDDPGAASDPWGIGDDSDDLGDEYADDEIEECGDEGSALDRVVDRSHRAGEGGPINRVQDRHAERFAVIDEEIGKVFATPMERHSWMMNQLNSMTSEMSPEDASMVKRLMKTAGEANVKGGNC